MHTITGRILSSTVTFALHVEVFPFTSITVRITVFIPRFIQLNVIGDTLMDAIPHASLEPLSICEAVMEAFPKASSCTVMFWQSAAGATLSCTVTVALQMETLPLLSVTVNTTALGPTLAQVNVFGATLK